MSSRSGSRELFQEVRAPDEDAAELRAWDVVRSVYREREAAPRPRSTWRLAPVPIAAAIAAVIALSPAGAAVHRWLDQALGLKHAHPRLTSLPAPGTLLISGATGAWTVSADGVRRRLGPWRQASWSPHGEYVLLAGSDQLLAADPRGVLRWSVSRPAVRFPRWFAPNGFRVAYLSGTTLRVIAGDGTGDRQLAANVALSAPSWRPGHEYQLAYAGPRGSVIVRDADTGNVLWSRTVGARPRLLSWSADGSRLLAVSGADALVFNGSGRRIATVPTPGGARALDAALSPDGQTLALLGDGEITLVALPPRPQVTRRVFAGEGLRQLAWSPDDQWLLVTWPPADEWVFIHATGRPRIIANSRIAEQFTGTAAFFPRIDGWCCTAAGSSG